MVGGGNSEIPQATILHSALSDSQGEILGEFFSLFFLFSEQNSVVCMYLTYLPTPCKLSFCCMHAWTTMHGHHAGHG